MDDGDSQTHNQPPLHHKVMHMESEQDMAYACAAGAVGCVFSRLF